MADAHRLDLQGAYNFRDVGGYRTANGKTVKREMIYRSEALAQLTDRDYEQLAALKIKVLCDFRGDDEKQRAPTKWRGSEVEMFPQPIEARSSSPWIAKLMQGGSASELKAMMTGLYGQFVTTNAPSYQRLMRRITDGGLPVLYHCSAGKDRTGVFTALLLRVLGVPKATVMEDYLLTNRYVLTEKAMATMAASMKGYGMTSIPSAEALKPLLAVEPEYLEAVFATIDKEHGSFDAFRRQALGLSDAEVRQLRKKLLQQPAGGLAAQQRLEVAKDVVRHQLIAFGGGMNAVTLHRIGQGNHRREEKRNQWRAVLGGGAGVHALKVADVVGAVVGWERDAGDEQLGAGFGELAGQHVYVLFGLG